ncbi:hypothetical protein Tco_0849508, partial [Tanacetum coccineum]
DRTGTALQQDGHLIAYLSKSLAPKHHSLSTYEKEFLVVLLALENTGVVYKQGKDNTVVDALSKKEDVGALFTMSTNSISTELYKRIADS